MGLHLVHGVLVGLRFGLLGRSRYGSGRGFPLACHSLFPVLLGVLARCVDRRRGLAVRGQALNGKLFSDGQEVVQRVLGDVHLAVIHEVEDSLELFEPDALEVKKGVGLVLLERQDFPEQG